MNNTTGRRQATAEELAMLERLRSGGASKITAGVKGKERIRKEYEKTLSAWTSVDDESDYAKNVITADNDEVARSMPSGSVARWMDTNTGASYRKIKQDNGTWAFDTRTAEEEGYTPQERYYRPSGVVAKQREMTPEQYARANDLYKRITIYNEEYEPEAGQRDFSKIPNNRWGQFPNGTIGVVTDKNGDRWRVQYLKQGPDDKGTIIPAPRLADVISEKDRKDMERFAKIKNYAALGVGMAARMGVAVGGSVGGALATGGTPVGSIGGGVIAAGAAENPIQRMEAAIRGEKYEAEPVARLINVIGVGIPFIAPINKLSFAKQIAARAAEGSVVGAGLTEAQTLAGEGRLASVGELGIGAGGGAIGGGLGHAVFGRALTDQVGNTKAGTPPQQMQAQLLASSSTGGPEIRTTIANQDLLAVGRPETAVPQGESRPLVYDFAAESLKKRRAETSRKFADVEAERQRGQVDETQELLREDLPADAIPASQQEGDTYVLDKLTEHRGRFQSERLPIDAAVDAELLSAARARDRVTETFHIRNAERLARNLSKRQAIREKEVAKQTQVKEPSASKKTAAEDIKAAIEGRRLAGEDISTPDEIIARRQAIENELARIEREKQSLSSIARLNDDLSAEQAKSIADENAIVSKYDLSDDLINRGRSIEREMSLLERERQSLGSLARLNEQLAAEQAGALKGVGVLGEPVRPVKPIRAPEVTKQVTPEVKPEAKPIFSKEPISVKSEIAPKTENPYLKMPIQRVEDDARHGVKLAQAALEQRNKEITQRQGAQNAIQEPSTAEVPVRQASQTGEKVGQEIRGRSEPTQAGQAQEALKPYNPDKSDAALIAAWKASRRKAGKKTKGSIDASILEIPITIGRKIYATVKDFADWSRHMIDIFGSEIGKQLKRIYEASKKGFGEAINETRKMADERRAAAAAKKTAMPNIEKKGSLSTLSKTLLAGRKELSQVPRKEGGFEYAQGTKLIREKLPVDELERARAHIAGKKKPEDTPLWDRMSDKLLDTRALFTRDIAWLEHLWSQAARRLGYNVESGSSMDIGHMFDVNRASAMHKAEGNVDMIRYDLIDYARDRLGKMIKGKVDANGKPLDPLVEAGTYIKLKEYEEIQLKREQLKQKLDDLNNELASYSEDNQLPSKKWPKRAKSAIEKSIRLAKEEADAVDAELARLDVADFPLDATRRGLEKLRNLHGDVAFNEFEKIARRYKKHIDRMIDINTYGGKLSGIKKVDANGNVKRTGSAGYFADNYKYYTPKIVTDYIDDIITGGRPKAGISVSDPAIRARTGMGEGVVVENPFTSLMERMAAATIDAERNRVSRTIGKMWTTDPNGTWVRKSSSDSKTPNGWEKLSYWEHGKRRYYILDKKVADGLRASTSQAEWDAITSVISRTNSLFRFGVTGAFNLGFQSANYLARDPMRFMIMSNYGIRHPMDIVTYLPDFIMGSIYSAEANLPGIRHAVQAIGKSQGMHRVTNKERIAFQKIGAEGSTFSRYLDPEYEDNIRRLFAQNGDKPPSWLKYTRGIYHEIANLGATFEEAQRLTALRRGMRKEGITYEDVASYGNPETRAKMPREVIEKIDRIAYEVINYGGSPNFRRTGMRKRLMQTWLPFSTARASALELDLKRISEFKNNPKAAAAAAGALAIAVGIPSVKIASLNLAPENVEDWKRRPEYEREKYIMIPLYEDAPAGLRGSKPRYAKDAEGKQFRVYRKIPMEGLIGATYSMVNAFLRSAAEKNPIEVAEGVQNVLEGMSPINISLENPASAIANLAPLPRVILSTASNHDYFTRKSIVSPDEQKREGYLQYNPRYVSKWAPAAAAYLHEKTGGRISVSPAKADFIVNQLTGGLAQNTPLLSKWTGSEMPAEGLSDWENQRMNTFASKLVGRFTGSQKTEDPYRDNFTDIVEESHSNNFLVRLKADEAWDSIKNMDTPAEKVREAKRLFREGEFGRINGLDVDYAGSADDKEKEAKRYAVKVYEEILDRVQDQKRGVTAAERAIRNQIPKQQRVRYFTPILRDLVGDELGSAIDRHINARNLTGEDLKKIVLDNGMTALDAWREWKARKGVSVYPIRGDAPADSKKTEQEKMRINMGSLGSINIRR